MIDERFTVVGLWVVAILITFIILGGLACIIMGGGFMRYNDSLMIMLIIFVVIGELVLCSIYVTFKNNPENYGYTRIEQGAETQLTKEEIDKIFELHSHEVTQEVTNEGNG